MTGIRTSTERASVRPVVSKPYPRGVAHVGVTVLEIEESGGEHTSEARSCSSVRSTYEDPWGTVVEIYTRRHERIYGNQGDY